MTTFLKRVCSVLFALVLLVPPQQSRAETVNCEAVCQAAEATCLSLCVIFGGGANCYTDCYWGYQGCVAGCGFPG